MRDEMRTGQLIARLVARRPVKNKKKSVRTIVGCVLSRTRVLKHFQGRPGKNCRIGPSGRKSNNDMRESSERDAQEIVKSRRHCAAKLRSPLSVSFGHLLH
jgi:hypothetical protein